MSTELNDEFVIPLNRFHDTVYIEARVSKAPESTRGVLRTALKFLYLTDGPLNLSRERLKAAFDQLERREQILTRWLATRTNGRLRPSYGSKALQAARLSRYRCVECGFSDVRAYTWIISTGERTVLVSLVCAPTAIISSHGNMTGPVKSDTVD